jgi:Kef-type K+ transport system membrane component KefB
MPKKRWLPTALVLFLSCSLGAVAGEEAGMEGLEFGERMTELVFQLAAILIAAKVGAFVCQRYLHIPEVLGELGAGIIIGPYCLGPVLGLFTHVAHGSGIPVSPELYGIATVASILLLYLAGLETDIGMFMRYSVAGSLVGVGGVVVSFLLGNAVAVWTGLAPSYLAPAALFMGAISTATSVGITARVLSQRKKIDSPEGVTILAGAVVDDVLGIVVLAIVVGMCRHSGAEGGVQWGHIAWIAARAIGFWAICTGLGMLLAKKISKVLEFFGSRETMATLSFGLALLLAGLAERAHLAMIIGAYIMGLSLSRVDAAHELRHRLQPVCDTLVAVFFAVMGMMVDLAEVRAVIVVGLLYTLTGAVAKILGCGIPALFTRFRPLGALRIGVGMLPRGEVTLLMAGVGLAGGFIGKDVFGVAVMMTLVSTLLAPLAMNRLFDDRSGVRGTEEDEKAEAMRSTALDLPNVEVAEFLLQSLCRMFEHEDCYVHQLGRAEDLYQVRKDDLTITARREGSRVELTCGEDDFEFAKLILLEGLANLITVFEGLRRMQVTSAVRREL